MLDIIDFHTHPLLCDEENICHYKEVVNITWQTVAEDMDAAGVSCFCGSVINRRYSDFDDILILNRHALKLRELYQGRYIPGIHIHPDYVEQSCTEIDFAYNQGVRLIGEIVPSIHGWSDYSRKGFAEILDYIKTKNMVVSLHTVDLEQMSVMASEHKDINFVFAHPGEKPTAMRHLDIMKKHDNVFLDISGTGIFRYGLLKKMVDTIGEERILFGSDYPCCNLQMYVGGVLGDKISDSAKEHIFSKNAKRLLGMQ